MLVLSRKNLESLQITVPYPDGTKEVIKVQVVGITGKLARLGIEADRKVTILRQELIEGKTETEAAAK